MIAIVPYQRGWKSACSAEIAGIRSATASLRMFVDWVGSTAIAGLEGKPIIDLLVTPVDWQDAGRITAALATIGYVSENANSGLPREFLVKRAVNAGPISFHVHIAPRESDWGRNMLVFRDQLAADRSLAKRYAALKRQLALAHASDLEAYTQGKSDFVAEVLSHADGAFGNERLLTYQRVELDCSRRFQDMALIARCGGGGCGLSIFGQQCYSAEFCHHRFLAGGVVAGSCAQTTVASGRRRSGPQGHSACERTR